MRIFRRWCALVALFVGAYAVVIVSYELFITAGLKYILALGVSQVTGIILFYAWTLAAGLYLVYMSMDGHYVIHGFRSLGIILLFFGWMSFIATPGNIVADIFDDSFGFILFTIWPLTILVDIAGELMKIYEEIEQNRKK